MDALTFEQRKAAAHMALAQVTPGDTKLDAWIVNCYTASSGPVTGPPPNLHAAHVLHSGTWEEVVVDG